MGLESLIKGRNVMSYNIGDRVKLKGKFGDETIVITGKCKDIALLTSKTINIYSALYGDGYLVFKDHDVDKLILRNEQRIRAKKNWQRAFEKAKKINQGNKEGNLKMLEPNYWIEKLDPKHRPTTELNKLKSEWGKSGSKDFIEWLATKTPVSQVYYFTDEDRRKQTMSFKNNQLLFGESVPQLTQSYLSTYEGTIIFVLDPFDNFYFSFKQLGRLQHSSMYEGKPVKAAGTIMLKKMEIIWISNHSGHYKPGIKEMKKCVLAIKKKGATIENIDFKLYLKNKWEGKGNEILTLN